MHKLLFTAKSRVNLALPRESLRCEHARGRYRVTARSTAAMSTKEGTKKPRGTRNDVNFLFLYALLLRALCTSPSSPSSPSGIQRAGERACAHARTKLASFLSLRTLELADRNFAIGEIAIGGRPLRYLPRIVPRSRIDRNRLKAASRRTRLQLIPRLPL